MTTNRADAPPPEDREPTLEEILHEAGRDESFTVGDLARENPGFESDEEIDDFIAAVHRWRNESMA